MAVIDPLLTDALRGVRGDAAFRAASPLTLADLPAGTPARVVAVQAPRAGGGEDWPRQLADLGFTPGERVTVLRRGWPGGDPVAVRVGVSTFALRRAEATCVRVEPIA